jgi:hypothetical protein
VQLVVNPGPAYVQGRGVFEELFFHGVAAEAGHRAKLPADS